MKQKCNFALFMTGFYLIWMLRATWIYNLVDQSIPGEAQRLIFSNIVKFMLWVLPAAGYIIWCRHQPVLDSLKVNTSVDSKGLVRVGVVSILYFAVVLGAEFFLSQRTLEPLFHSSAREILDTSLTIFFSPITEELFFRGLVINELEARFGFWKANFLQALLFMLIHWPNWIWTSGFQRQMLITSGGIFILAMLLGWAVKRTNSIWSPVAIHFVNNFLAAFLG